MWKKTNILVIEDEELLNNIHVCKLQAITNFGYSLYLKDLQSYLSILAVPSQIY